MILKAIVTNANMDYSLVWQCNEGDDIWKVVTAGSDTFGVTADMSLNNFYYRVVLTAANGTVIESGVVTLIVTETAEEAEEEAQEEPAEEEPREEPAAEEPAAEEPATEAPAAEEPAGEEPAGEEPAGEEPAEEEPQDEEAEGEEPAAEEIGEYETPLGLEEQPAESAAPAPAYAYERDENGALILDANGNPIVTVLRGNEIPVSYLRDENGALVLDENGDPIPTQTVPVDAMKIYTLEDALDPDRKIDIYAFWGDEEPALGGTVYFRAIPYGYDRVVYTIQWQMSSDNSTWNDIAGAYGTDYSTVITEENYKNYWRVKLTITNVKD